MKYPKIRELKEAVKAIIKGPCTTKFPNQPHIPMHGFRGKPSPDEKECVACGACAEICPAGAIEIREDKSAKPPVREIIWHYDKCIFCGQCERLCTTAKGVKLSREFDLATVDRSTLKAKVGKELVVCEGCGEIVGTKSHLLWLARRLGPLASGNYNLIFLTQKELGLVEDTGHGKQQAPGAQRADLYRVLCPRCRHVVVVLNETGKKP